MISYPSVLPNPTVNYSIKVANSHTRTQMESGKIRQRRRFIDSQNEASLQFHFTDDEFHFFESFMFHNLAGGNDYFEMQLPSGGGLTTHAVRFQTATYTSSYRGFLEWVVEVKVDIKDINRLPAELVDFVLELELPLPLSNLDNYLLSLEQLVNIHTLQA